jgi:hypothetical protein
MNPLSKKSIINYVFILILFISLIIPIPVSAQGNNWQTDLDCADSQYQGITYCQGLIPNDNSTTTNIHVIAVDLQAAGVHFEYIIASGKDKNGNIAECRDVNRTAKGRIGCDDPKNPAYYPLLPWDQTITPFSDTAVLVTSDYGAGDQNVPSSREHGPEGLTIVRGTRLDGKLMNDGDNNAVNRPWLALSDPPSVNVLIDQLNQDDGEKPYPWIYTALGGAPWMIRAGEVQTEYINKCTAAGGSCYSEASQVAVGITRDKRWLFIVVGEKPQPSNPGGPTPLLNMAYFMKDVLGVFQAFKLDGGGSTKLWYAGENIYVDSNRQLSQYLAVIASPVSEQQEEPPAGEEEPSPLAGISSWFDQLWQSISSTFQKWLDKQGQNLQQEFSRWLEKQQQALQNWAAGQLTDWLNSLCGTAWIPAIALAGVWFLKRRKPNRPLK